jgi:hypothetical protein
LANKLNYIPNKPNYIPKLTMAKRFTDTEKWKKPFIRGLQAPYKLLWLYICDDCDHAGIWQVDIEVAQIRIGETINEAEALEIFGDKIVTLNGGTKWFIPSFVEFQYPSGLSAINKAHVNIIKILEKYKNEIDKIKVPTSPLQGAKEYGIGIGIGTGIGLGTGKVNAKGKIVNPKKVEQLFSESPYFDLETFKEQFTGTQYAGANFEYYHEVINNWSASNGNKKKDWIATAKNWMASDMTKGKFIDKNFKPTTNATTKTYQTRTSHISSEQLHESLAKRFGGRDNWAGSQSNV